MKRLGNIKTQIILADSEGDARKCIEMMYLDKKLKYFFVGRYVKKIMKKMIYLLKPLQIPERFLSNILVNDYNKSHKNYVVMFQTPVMKTLFDMYTTTITMKKIK